MCKAAWRLQNMLSLMCILAIVLWSACGDNGSKNSITDDDNDDTGDTLELLVPTTKTILENADDTFETLLATSSREQARETLIDHLNTSALVDTAVLFEDGSTVWVTFTDGTYGIVPTIDTDALASGVESLDYGASKTVFDPTTDTNSFPSVIQDVTSSVLTPDKRKVLLLDIAEPSVPCAGNVQRMKHLFLSNGWDESDIVVKTRSSQTDMSITPYDMFNLGEYGIVIIYAHGIYGKQPGTGGADPGYHYIQLCSALSRSDPYADNYKAWRKQGLLVPSSSEGIYIRSDLLMQQLQHMSNTIVYLNSCWGWYEKNAFMSNGCGAFYSWDDLVMFVDAFPSVNALFAKMSRSNPATTVSEAFDDPTLTRESLNYEGRTATLHLETNKEKLYLPTWAEITVTASSLPAGTDRIWVGGSISWVTISSVSLPTLKGGTLNDLAPGSIQFTAQALKGYTVVGSKDITVDLHAGKNQVSLDFSYYTAKEQLLAWTRPSTTAGRLNTDFITYYVFPLNTNSNRYKVINYNHLTTTTQELRTPEQGEEIIYLNYCLRQEDVIRYFGSNIFEIGTDEAVYCIMRGSHRNYREDDQEAIAELEETYEISLIEIANYYIEVYHL